MHWRSARTTRGGEGLLLAVVLLLILGALAWYLFSSRRNTEREAWAYAREVAEHVILQRDSRWIDANLSYQAQLVMPPSFRERIFTKLAELGTPNRDIKLTGHVTFSSYFFDARGNFRAEATFPNGPAHLIIAVSPSHGPWQIEGLDLIWDPHSKF